MKRGEAKKDGDILLPAQRWAGLAALVAMVLLFGFFAIHQFANTGYFTAAFESFEKVCLYGPILVSLAPPIARALSGRRNPARPFEAASNLALAIGSLWLAIVFPFNFAHLTDVLPVGIRFIFSWINNGIGRLVLILQVIIGVITTPLTIFIFFSIRRRTSPA